MFFAYIPTVDKIKVFGFLYFDILIVIEKKIALISGEQHFVKRQACLLTRPILQQYRKSQGESKLQFHGSS